MADGLPRFCIFGDSHYACLKQAEVQGLADVSGVELEYWGHVGGRFRYLEYRDGAVHPQDEFTAQRFAKFNAKGREILPAAEFDVILVMGARVYVWRLFDYLLRILAEGPFVSEGLLRRYATDWLRAKAGYRLAAGLASTETARVLLAPVAFYTVGAHQADRPETPGARALIPERLPQFWQILTEVAAQDGVMLLPQPEDTVAEGMFTSEAYAVEGHVAKQDFEHHNAAYGAKILSLVMPIARSTPRRD